VEDQRNTGEKKENKTNNDLFITEENSNNSLH
jgi:hypothetical protein